jgi:hypothetical protein
MKHLIALTLTLFFVGTTFAQIQLLPPRRALLGRR